MNVEGHSVGWGSVSLVVPALPMFGLDQELVPPPDLLVKEPVVAVKVIGAQVHVGGDVTAPKLELGVHGKVRNVHRVRNALDAATAHQYTYILLLS